MNVEKSRQQQQQQRALYWQGIKVFQCWSRDLVNKAEARTETKKVEQPVAVTTDNNPQQLMCVKAAGVEYSIYYRERVLLVVAGECYRFFPSSHKSGAIKSYKGAKRETYSIWFYCRGETPSNLQEPRYYSKTATTVARGMRRHLLGRTQ